MVVVADHGTDDPSRTPRWAPRGMAPRGKAPRGRRNAELGLPAARLMSSRWTSTATRAPSTSC